MRTGRKEHTMAAERMTLVDVLRKGEDPEVDFLCEGMRWLIQQLMETEVSAQIGAERYQRSDERTTQRNGYRTRAWDTRLGTLELAIPKLRTGSYFPSWLDARSEEHTSELQSRQYLVCRLLLEKKKTNTCHTHNIYHLHSTLVVL